MGRKPKPINSYGRSLKENEVTVSGIDLNNDGNIVEKIILNHILAAECENNWKIVILEAINAYKIDDYNEKSCLFKIYSEGIYLPKMNFEEIIKKHDIVDKTEYSGEPMLGVCTIILYSDKD